jgi:murein DD-endopeptidase MepM/ murein hydrolase activator NlpD
MRHDGIDIMAREGTHILAAADGLVGYADNRVQGYGNLLVILHADGTSTLYAHCRAIFVAAGEHVRRGQIVAEVGSTGISRGPHLHFEWHREGEPIDPEPALINRPD